ncbi:MAG: type II toxin-antitoxin system Phd/YefM family antitoxin [Gemmatimonadota bacterium]|jgi:prevent-host-death family protein
MKVSLRQAEKQLYALVAAVEQGGERVVLTRSGRPVATLLPVAALDALDLLGRLLPDVAEVAARFPPLDPEAPGLGPAPGDETHGDTTSDGPAENRAPEVSVPSPPPGSGPTEPEASP